MRIHDMKKIRFSFLIVSVLVLLQAVAVFAQKTLTVQERKASLDPYGKKAVLGYLLRLPILINLVSTELGMTESQKDAFAQVVKSEEKELDDLYRTSSYYGAEVYNERYRQILLNTDTELRKLLSPIQYASLRDWIIEQWALERGETALPLDEIVRIGTHRINLLKSELVLSSQKEEKISSALVEYKNEALLLRRKLVALAQNPLNSWENLENEGRKIVQNIKMLSENLDKAIIENLSSKQKVIYQRIKFTKQSKSSKGERRR